MEAPQGKPYEGPSGIGRDSHWLTAEDLIEGKDATVTIENIILYPKVKFEAGRERLNYLGLKFKGKERILGLNATNRKALNAAFGNVVLAWKGQSITLFVSETQMAGETKKCVRIRNPKARTATASEDLGHDDEPTATESAPVNGTPAAGATVEQVQSIFGT